ncbi:hypothetical protein MN116_000538 [Schistosoma mekongi]|uniref:Uncharacterized protein n=1 Tax=Schistosoma mekongi TaxID=38744 RepID=A0AAE1ZDW2_SCHME|nr:hypothetical protein MN116_000538 [Schistosoma mekongi]
MHSILTISIALISISILNVGYTNKTRNWDYLQLVLVWPPSYCTHNPCNLHPGLDDFIIGGFRPTIRPYIQQTNCSNDKQFNMSYIMRAKSKLEKKWPNLTDYTNSEGLWESEWNHHGRCAVQARSTRNQHRYFKAALSLLDNLDLLDKLDDYGIEPDSETLVRKKQFLKTIRRVYNVRTLLKCIPFNGKKPDYEYTSSKDKYVQTQIFSEITRNQTQFYQLNEVIFCYNSKLQLINCSKLMNNEYHECNNGFIFKEFNDSLDDDDNHRDDDDDDDDDNKNDKKHKYDDDNDDDDDKD